MSKTRIHITIDEEVAEAIPEYVNVSEVANEKLRKWAEEQGFIQVSENGGN